MFFGRTDAKAETPVLWPPHAKSWLIGKDSGAGRDWGQEEKGTTEDEIAGWHHWLDGHEFEWTPGVGNAQGGLACCNSWGRKESDTTEWLNWTELRKKWYPIVILICISLWIMSWALFNVPIFILYILSEEMYTHTLFTLKIMCCVYIQKFSVLLTSKCCLNILNMCFSKQYLQIFFLIPVLTLHFLNNIFSSEDIFIFHKVQFFFLLSCVFWCHS